MKKYFSVLLFTVAIALSSPNAFCQSVKDSIKIYDAGAVAKDQLNAALKFASEQHKNIIVQIGNQQSTRCKRFYSFIKKNHEIDSIINKNYVVVYINYSQENKNLPLMRALEFPQRFPLPVLVIMDMNGKRLNTQNTVYLESTPTFYDKQKVVDFLKDWSPEVFEPTNYEK